MRNVLLAAVVVATTQGCVGMAIGGAAKATKAVVTVPVKAGAAAVDVMTESEEEKKKKEEKQARKEARKSR